MGCSEQVKKISRTPFTLINIGGELELQIIKGIVEKEMCEKKR